MDLGPGNTSQNGQKPNSLMKNPKPKTKKFFSLQTQGFAECFKGLNSSHNHLANYVVGKTKRLYLG